MIKKHLAFLYRHNFVRYVFVGGSTFILDFSILFCLQHFTNVSLTISTSIAYWVAIAYNFTLNRWWTFSASESKKLHQHLTLYLMLLGANYLVTLLIVLGLSNFIYFGWAKIAAVAVQVLWTYPIYKKVIFTKNDKNNPASIALE